ncbi:MAG: AmmeMemoRadiSam system radical SAM enzyme [Candidatus Firestonebacteria bacterium]
MKLSRVFLFSIVLIVFCLNSNKYLPGSGTTPSTFTYEAKYWKKIDNDVQCLLCPFRCVLKDGQKGNCRVRINIKGKLYTLVYGRVVAKNVDPIEKKPVFHMLPGTTAYSIATVGCNLRCKFCQNWQISQSNPEEVNSEYLSPQDVVLNAIKLNCKSIAYTYSEPVVFYEYVLDTAKLAKKNGLKNILVTGGFINPEPLKELLQYFDVIKVDLKGFNEKFYEEVVSGDLQCVLNTLLTIKKNSKVIIEVVNLVVPGLNDSFTDIKKMCKWIKENLGSDTPLFFSKFYPNYKLRNLPETPILTLEKCRDIALKEGLNYVYIGNVVGHPGESTYCPKCKKNLIKRLGYDVLENNIVKGKCKFCGNKIPGIWEGD